MRKIECHMIPTEEKKCIWMTTGLISYKLCTLDYRCEACVFDQVMRNEMDVQEIRSGQPAAKNIEVVPKSTAPQANIALFYHPNHCWAKVEDPDEVRIGIDSILARFVANIKTVVLPQPGEPVTQGQCFAHIILAKHILQLVSPVTGTIATINPELRKKPQLLANSPWDNGWLVTIRPENLEHDLRSLLFGKKALAWYESKEQLAAGMSAAMLNKNSAALGPTMQDGGKPMPFVVDELSSEQFDQIIESLSRIENPVS